MFPSLRTQETSLRNDVPSFATAFMNMLETNDSIIVHIPQFWDGTKRCSHTENSAEEINNSLGAENTATKNHYTKHVLAEEKLNKKT